jgi:hypothetical protein
MTFIHTINRKLMVGLLAVSFCVAAQAQETMMDSNTMDEGAMDSGAATQMESTEPANDQPVPEPAAQQPSINDDTIARAQFTTAVVDHEPTDNITTLTNDHFIVYFFTEIVGAQGETYTHRWEYEGQQMAEVTFNVGGPRWRVYSSKNLKPEWTGTWTVTVLDSAGNPVKVSSFDLVEAQPRN